MERLVQLLLTHRQADAVVRESPMSNKGLGVFRHEVVRKLRAARGAGFDMYGYVWHLERRFRHSQKKQQYSS